MRRESKRAYIKLEGATPSRPLASVFLLIPSTGAFPFTAVLCIFKSPSFHRHRTFQLETVLASHHNNNASSTRKYVASNLDPVGSESLTEPCLPVIFVGLNIVRVLSVIALILVFASNIVIMVHDVQAVNKFISEVKHSDNSTLAQHMLACDYVEFVQSPLG